MWSLPHWLPRCSLVQCAGCQCKEQSWFPRITAGWWPWLSACCQGQWASPMVSIWAAYRYIMPKGEVGNVCLSVEGSCFLRTLWPPSKSCWNLQHSFESEDGPCLFTVNNKNQQRVQFRVSLPWALILTPIKNFIYVSPYSHDNLAHGSCVDPYAVQYWFIGFLLWPVLQTKHPVP